MISKQGNAPAYQLTNKDQSTVSGMGHGGEINHLSPQMGRFVDTKYSTGDRLSLTHGSVVLKNFILLGFYRLRFSITCTWEGKGI